MSNVNQNNRFKFIANANTTTNSSNITTRPAQKYTHTVTVRPSESDFKKPAIVPTISLINIADDDDFDISDSELIMASQEVESQLRFTNNVHHTTSNTVNIFSQIASSNQMPAPQMTAMGVPTQLLNSTNTNMYPSSSSANNNNTNYTNRSCLVDDLQSEIKQLKTEKMAKEGEVKILRDKLKRLEQDSQRTRTEKVELVKKLQLQKEEEKRGLLKQIEFKDLENQFKNQEIVELSMKCKQLESSNRKAGAMTSPASHLTLQQHQQKQEASASQHNLMFDELNSISSMNAKSNNNNNNNSSNKCPPTIQPSSSYGNKSGSSLLSANQQVIGSKGIPTKRLICQTSISSLGGLSDAENENPTHDTKRALMSVNNQFTTIVKSELREPSALTVSSSSTKQQVLQNSTNNISNSRVLAKPISKLQQTTATTSPQTTTPKSVKHLPQVAVTIIQPTPPPPQKRTFTLNTKTNYRMTDSLNTEHQIPCKNDKNYLLTNVFAESADFLFKFNHQSKFLDQKQIAQFSWVSSLNRRLANLVDFLQDNLNASPLCPMQLFGGKAGTNNKDQVLCVVERIEYVSKRLNDEMLKLIHYLSSNQKIMTPSNTLACVDLVCLSFQICAELFLFRCAFLLLSNVSYVNPNDQEIDSALLKRLIQLKEAFFLLVSNLIQSIQFDMENADKKSKTHSLKSSFSKRNDTSSFSSYTTLKILNTVINCYNKVIYLPNLNQCMNADSVSTCFYVGLVDNMHGTLNKLKMFKIVKPIQLKDNLEKKINQEFAISIEDFDELDQSANAGRIDIDIANNEADEEEEEEEEDNPCLFQLFFQKLIKYFGDIIYSIESNEYRTENRETTTSPSTTSNLPSNLLHNESIITTIVAAGSEQSNEDIDYKLETESSCEVEKKMPISRSESDIFSELQSQTVACETDETTKKKPLVNLTVSSSSYLPSSPPNLGSTSTNESSIQSLQIEFLTKLIKFLHNLQFYESLKFKLQAKSTKSNLIQRNTNHKCSCHNDMLFSFLIMIDYKFNEKFINGSRLDLNEFFLTPYKSTCSFLLNKLSQNSKLASTGAAWTSLDSIEFSNVNNTALSKDTFNTDQTEDIEFTKKTPLLLHPNSKEESDKFAYLLIMQFMHLFLTLFNNKSKEKSKKDSILDDYRLKNFFCLFKLADLSYEEFFEYSKLTNNTHEHLFGFDLDEDKQCDTQQTGLFNHLFTSLDAQRSLLKTYIENYFYPTIE